MSETGITKGEYDWMKQEITQLQEKNLLLQENLKGLSSDNVLLQGNVSDLKGKNSDLLVRLDGLNLVVENLQKSEQELKGSVEKLTAHLAKADAQDLKNQLSTLEQMHNDTQIEIENLMERLNNLESGSKQATTSGIFTYIENEADQSLFIKKVEEALSQSMTYAQIDEYLTTNLSSELDKIIKDHPALTKNYIRTLRKD